MNTFIGHNQYSKLCPEERFWEKVDKGLNEECWIWIGALNNDGYGNFLLGGKSEKAHRFSWILHYGEIPSSLCVCHHCDNPSCVNPNHLFLGTHKDNMQDMTRKKRLKIPSLRGEKCGSSKLSDKEVELMRNIYKSTIITTRNLGKIFGVSQAQACRIVNYKSRT